MEDVQARGAEERIAGEGSSAGTIAAEVAAGAAVGAVMGSIAGPPGAAIGALIGGAVGGAAGAALGRDEHEKQVHDEQLDRDIGVSGGTIGEPSLKHPPSLHGLYHNASLGISSGGGAESSDGPIQNVDGSE